MLLYLPPSLRRFEPRWVVEGARIEFIELAYDLVHALRPRLVVDLGAGNATSFFTFCQAVHDYDIDGTCYAVDPLFPDEDDQVQSNASFDAINEHARKHYPGLAYLVPVKPSAARQSFGMGTIDLLRIDGTRSDLVSADELGDWIRRLSPGGVLLYYGIDHAGAAAAWRGIANEHESFDLEREPGLGVIRKAGGESRAELLELLFDDREQLDVRRFYDHIREHHVLARELSGVNLAGLSRRDTSPAGR